MFEIKNVSMIYDMDSDEKMYALNGVDLVLPDKGMVGIIGPSGSGKSTLMYCMSTLKKPTEGTILYNGQDITAFSDRQRESLRRNEFGFVFQKHYLVPYMTAMDNVVVAGISNDKEVNESAAEILSALGLKERDFHKRPSKLSGGQCQRTAIARAIINNPRVIFADEPTASLDHENAFNVMRILKKYSEDRLVIVVTHDRSILSDVDMIVEIWDGRLSNAKQERKKDEE
ncbi:MAG: ABC transporter ATP-binding protein [Clostridium sp.]|nr:ABC transporter ATP-binding protein [Clostridium sp.]MCM1207595.1 ABC transporter ATP-binding protein [Ruminococcus sp.]MCM1288299.1 ABC transporter ATP-binding protein [Clostridium sp.]